MPIYLSDENEFALEILSGVSIRWYNEKRI